MIRLDDVSLSFGDSTVLDGVSTAIDRGEFVGLVGPNGAGKTTLLRVINGVLRPDTGAVSLDGERVADLQARAVSRRVATVPQDTQVGFAFDARQVVEMGRTPHRSRLDWSDDSDLVERAMARTETLALEDRSVDSLSGGERQRVLVARALAQASDALLLDEPTASLDINHQVQVLDLVSGLVEEGRAALAAIHDLDLAARFCDRLLLLHDGRIRADGSPGAVLADDAIETAFRTETAVSRDHVTGTPRVAALPDRPARDGQVHVAVGGANGAAAVRALWRAGYEVTVGPVPPGDIGSRVAADLDLRVVTAPAAGSPDDRAEAAARVLADGADVLVTGADGTATGQLDTGGDRPRVRAALDGAGAGPARGDGGATAHAETESALVEAVERCLRR